MEIDWSKAPGWAYAFAQVIYGHETNTKDFAWISEYGYNVNPFGPRRHLCHPYGNEIFSASNFKIIEFRPTQPWSGKGLPPVGVEVEALLPALGTARYWQAAKVVHGPLPDSPTEILVFSLENTKPSWVDEFRPIRTPEQIAAEEQDRRVEDLCDFLMQKAKDLRVPMSEAGSQDLAVELEKAGYRKQEPKPE